MPASAAREGTSTSSLPSLAKNSSRITPYDEPMRLLAGPGCDLFEGAYSDRAEAIAHCV
jgi:hypothetical protein